MLSCGVLATIQSLLQLRSSCVKLALLVSLLFHRFSLFYTFPFRACDQFVAMRLKKFLEKGYNVVSSTVVALPLHTVFMGILFRMFVAQSLLDCLISVFYFQVRFLLTCKLRQAVKFIFHICAHYAQTAKPRLFSGGGQCLKDDSL